MSGNYIINYDKNRDFYSILGVSPNATPEELRKAYRHLSTLYHPDLNPGNIEAEEKMKTINEAYETLMTIEKRQEYDRQRRASLPLKEKFNFGRKIDNLTSKFNRGSTEAYDEYIKFLKDMEPFFNMYGLTLDSYREGVAGKRGKISAATFEEYKKTLKRELEYIKKRARAFDEFQVFSKTLLNEIQSLHNKSIANMQEYTNPSNRTKIDPEKFERKKVQITKLLDTLREARFNELDKLEKLLTERNLDYNSFITLKGLKEKDLSMKKIKELIEIVYLLDQLAFNLKPTGKTLMEFLGAMNLNIMQITKEELEELLKGLNNMPSTNLEELDQLLKNDDEEPSRRP